MKEEIKKIFFSKFVLIVLASFYVIYSIFSWLGEYFIGKIDLQWSLFLRGSTIILDVAILVTGVFTWLQVHLRKKVKRLKILEKERITVMLYIADTIAILVVFFFPYVTRLFVLLKLNKITTTSFWIDAILASLIVFILAAFFKKISRKFNKWGRKLRIKNGYHKKN